jgi:hypothetical protein
MLPPELPLELLLMIAHHIRDEHGGLRYGDFNSFLQVNRILHACLNRKLWQEAGQHSADTQRVLTHLIVTNNLAGLSFFLSLGADVEARLPAFDIIGLDGDGFGPDHRSWILPALLVAADEDNAPLARLLLENGAKARTLILGNRGRYTGMPSATKSRLCARSSSSAWK